MRITHRISSGRWFAEEAIYKRARATVKCKWTLPMSSDYQETRSMELNLKLFPSEKRFIVWWNAIVRTRLQRNRPMLNRFFADFVDFQKKTVFEIDGRSHDGKEEYDKIRDSLIEASGFRVIRLNMKQTDEEWKTLLKEYALQ